MNIYEDPYDDYDWIPIGDYDVDYYDADVDTYYWYEDHYVPWWDDDYAYYDFEEDYDEY